MFCLKKSHFMEGMLIGLAVGGAVTRRKMCYPRSRSRQGSGQQYDEINLRKGGNRFLHAQPPNAVGSGQQTGRMHRKRNKIYCTEYQSVQYRYILNLVFPRRRHASGFFRKGQE